MNSCTRMNIFHHILKTLDCVIDLQTVANTTCSIYGIYFDKDMCQKLSFQTSLIRTQMVRTERNAVNSQLNYLNANNGLAFSVRKKEKRQVV